MSAQGSASPQDHARGVFLMADVACGTWKPRGSALATNDVILFRVVTDKQRKSYSNVDDDWRKRMWSLNSDRVSIFMFDQLFRNLRPYPAFEKSTKLANSFCVLITDFRAHAWDETYQRPTNASVLEPSVVVAQKHVYWVHFATTKSNMGFVGRKVMHKMFT